ncbi:MAG: LacI family DNA-binding transcriptional regulator, partial [Phycisphaeraceae bacterium]
MTRAKSQPRLKDVARQAGVSAATASMALSDHPHVHDATKQRVRQISHELGYRPRPRASHAGRAMRRTGLLVLGEREEEQTELPIMAQLARAAGEQQVRLEYTFTDPDLSSEENHAAAGQFVEGVDGLLLLGMVTPALIEQLRAREAPCVVLGHCMTEPGGTLPVSTVAFDNLAMGLAATEHLFAQGHRRIAFVCERTPRGLSHDRWLRGYRLAHAQRGLVPDPALVQITGERRSGATEPAANLACLADPPTGYIAPDDRIASSLLAALVERGVTVPPGALIYESRGPASDPPVLAEHGWVSGRFDLMAQHGLHQLERVCANPAEPPVQVLVPFE